ncbi:MAG: hypothetical protein FWD32_01580 [Firmicutes bacterium]|nr:hypothetical protein [Bacillota bacterium]
MKTTNWNKNEIAQLLKLVENSSNRYTAFITHAKIFNRKPNSVRNFYYQLIKDNTYGAKHIASKTAKFTATTTNNLIKEILLATTRGQSVRNTCLTLSNNNPQLMLRMQNKYRNILSKKPEQIEKVKQSLTAQGYIVNTPKLKTVALPNNIIKLPTQKQPPLTDQDLANLFMGIIKLVKNNEKEIK